VQLSSLVDYIRELEAWRLGGYDGDDVEYILHLLQHPQPAASTPTATGPRNITAVAQNQAPLYRWGGFWTSEHNRRPAQQ